MEGAASIEWNESRTLLDALQVGGGGGACFPFDRGGVKYAQAVISQTRDGNWKLTLQSDRQVEMMIEADSLNAIIAELKHAATREWERRS
jgi:hypothetical protein